MIRLPGDHRNVLKPYINITLVLSSGVVLRTLYYILTAYINATHSGKKVSVSAYVYFMKTDFKLCIEADNTGKSK
jgi:hypothetical protein